MNSRIGEQSCAVPRSRAPSPARRPQPARPENPRRLDRVLEQRGLADARLSVHDDDGAMTVRAVANSRSSTARSRCLPTKRHARAATTITGACTRGTDYGFRDSIARPSPPRCRADASTRRDDDDEGSGCLTADDCALVLIDYQREMFEVIRSETSADLVELHVRLLAKTEGVRHTDRALDGGRSVRLQRADAASILSELDDIEPIDRTSMNAFEDPAFSEAVQAPAPATAHRRTPHRDLPHLRERPGAEGRLRRDVRHRRRRRTVASGAPHRNRRLAHAGAGADDALAVTTSCSATGRVHSPTPPRRHLLVLQRGPKLTDASVSRRRRSSRQPERTDAGRLSGRSASSRHGGSMGRATP